MTRARLLARMRAGRYAVQSSVSAEGLPQAATVGVAVSDRFEIVFDTLTSTRKYANLSQNPPVAIVMGSLDGAADWGLQIEGTVDEPAGPDRDRLVALYLTVFPGGAARQQWPELTDLRVTPTWIRWLDYGVSPPEVVEYDETALSQLV
jgi:hypothetical protein